MTKNGWTQKRDGSRKFGQGKKPRRLNEAKGLTTLESPQEESNLTPKDAPLSRPTVPVQGAVGMPRDLFGFSPMEAMRPRAWRKKRPLSHVRSTGTVEP